MKIPLMWDSGALRIPARGRALLCDGLAALFLLDLLCSLASPNMGL